MSFSKRSSPPRIPRYTQQQIQEAEAHVAQAEGQLPQHLNDDERAERLSELAAELRFRNQCLEHDIEKWQSAFDSYDMADWGGSSSGRSRGPPPHIAARMTGYERNIKEAAAELDRNDLLIERFTERAAQLKTEFNAAKRYSTISKAPPSYHTVEGERRGSEASRQSSGNQSFGYQPSGRRESASSFPSRRRDFSSSPPRGLLPGPSGRAGALPGLTLQTRDLPSRRPSQHQTFLNSASTHGSPHGSVFSPRPRDGVLGGASGASRPLFNEAIFGSRQRTGGQRTASGGEPSSPAQRRPSMRDQHGNFVYQPDSDDDDLYTSD